jgi:hypothetical protein
LPATNCAPGASTPLTCSWPSTCLREKPPEPTYATSSRLPSSMQDSRGGAGTRAHRVCTPGISKVHPRQARGLRRAGVQIGIDDFGTGYASLRYLREMPVTLLKVDRSFVAGMTTNHHDAVIVQTVTRLARDLGLGCIARRHRNRSTAATHPGDRSLCTRLPVRAPRAPPPTSCTTCAAQAPKRRGHNDSKRPPRACSSAPGSTLLLEPSSTCVVPPRIQVTIHCRAPFTADSRAAVRTAGPKHVRRLPGWTAVCHRPAWSGSTVHGSADGSDAVTALHRGRRRACH